MRSEELCQWKITKTPLGIETANFRVVKQWLNQLLHRVHQNCARYIRIILDSNNCYEEKHIRHITKLRTKIKVYFRIAVLSTTQNVINKSGSLKWLHILCHLASLYIINIFRKCWFRKDFSLHLCSILFLPRKTGSIHLHRKNANLMEINLMSLALLFHYLLLNMFRMLVHPSSGACDLLWIYFMGCIALVRCVLVLRCGSAGVVWYPYAGWSKAFSPTCCVDQSFWLKDPV